MINDNYTFRTFVAGENTRRALDAARAVAANPGRVHNPLVLVGKIGAGKTHLLYAIAQALRVRHVLHAGARDVSRRLSAACRGDVLDVFTGHDAVLFDDVHLSARRPSAQQYLAREIEKLVLDGAQVVLTADRRRGLVRVLEEGVPSTVVVDLPYPDQAARATILRRRSRERNVVLRPDEEREIVRTCSRSPREIHARVARLEATKL